MLEIIESNADFKRALKEIEKEREFSFDVETSGLNPFAEGAYLASIGIGTTTHEWTFPFNHHEAKLYRKLKRQRARMNALHNVLGKKKKVAHNGKFDALFIHTLFGHWWHPTFDTMLAHYNLDENEKHGLKSLSMRYFGDDGYDIPLEWKQGLEGPLEDHCIYLGKDVNYTKRLKRVFLRQFKEEPNAYKIFKHLTMPLSVFYTRVESRGVPIDNDLLEDGRDYWQEQAQDSKKQLDKLSKGWEPPANKKGKVPAINFGSPTQMVDLLFDHLDLQPLDKTPKGKWSTSESVLNRLDHPIGKEILRNREALKNLSTFIESWKSRMDSKGRIHPSFKIHGTVTGRPSCVEPNLQQTARDTRIRAIIRSIEKGWVLVEADYSQAELRLVADVANEQTLLDIYKQNGDVHTLTVQRVIGIMHPTKDERKKGKAINFGFIYGMWWKKFKEYARDNYGVAFNDKEAQLIRKKFFNTYQLDDWHKKQKALARSQGYVMNKIGRKRRLPNAMRQARGGYDYKKSEAERQAINSPIQSLASDINLMAGIEVDNTISHDKCQAIGTVHDANLFLIREKHLDSTLREIKAIMENPTALKKIFKCKLNVPLVADFKVGPWSKGVEYEF